MKDQPTPVQIKAECGNCAAWVYREPAGPVVLGEPRRGICYGVPPTPVAIYGGGMKVIGQRDLRSHPVENDTCLLFAPRSDLLPPAAPQD